MTKPFGSLFLVPTPLDFGCDLEAPLQDTLPMSTVQHASRIQYWISENAKSTRAFLKRVNEIIPLPVAIQQISIQELPREIHKKGDHLGAHSVDVFLKPATLGHDVGLISEAGMPAIADPGSSVVRAAHALKIPVIPLVGPVSLLLALAATGLSGQNFAFVGYLPQDGATRLQRLKELEKIAHQTGQTQVWIETPYRNAAIFDATLNALKSETRVAICSGLTLPQMDIRCMRIQEWKSLKPFVIASLPTVFALGI
ncbi:MAG: ribosomal RNA small subunit methyltransferase I [Limnohabitans sp.]|nr:ribosomal RNA small subunit methyltransferase I [Limnohabitans sp.]